MGSVFDPEDVFWGELGGFMEAIDGGITTVVDHAHLNISGEHCKHRQSNDFFSSSDYQHPPRSRQLWPLESAPSSCKGARFRWAP